MVRITYTFCALFSLSALTFACSDSSEQNSDNGDAGENSLTIGVVAKGTVHEYWKSVQSGAERAADELGVEILWDGPDVETNHTQQANIVDNMVNRGIDGLVLSPTNEVALKRPVDSAVRRGVPVLLIDSNLDSDKPLSFIATDNRAGGALAATTLAEAIGSNTKHGGKVVMLRYLEGSGSTERREAGFTEQIQQIEGLTLAEAAYTKGQGTETNASDTAYDMLVGFSNDEGVIAVDGIFASNQPTAIGMVKAIQRLRAQGKIIDAPYVGFDSSDLLLQGIKDGDIAALVVQKPEQMGYLGVKKMVEHLQGVTIEDRVDTGVAVIDSSNVDEFVQQ